jgi:L-alanine-DL-glutamate epimerase-like enolase superfamily enzyme
MPLTIFTLHSLEISFKQAFAHATAIRACTESVLVKAESSKDTVGVGEGCPRSYVTGETIETANAFFDSYRSMWEPFTGLDDLRAWMAANQKPLDANPAGWCAVELALFDLWGKERGQSLEKLLDLPELTGSFQYSAVLGTESVGAFQKQMQQFVALGFTDFKVKITGEFESDRQKINLLKDNPIKNLRIRVDANNLWKKAEDAIQYLQRFDYPFFAIEEPLQVGDYEGCRTISQELRIPIILDENFLRFEQFQHLQAHPKTWIINLRISKMGGILRSLAIAEQARVLGIPIIIGAQVGETSILTRAALIVANQFRDILLAQEGAFGTYLLERDITEAPLMFGKGGRLDAQSISGQPGLGLTLAPST